MLPIAVLTSALHPLQVATWGELAIAFHAHTVVVCSCMLIPPPEDYNLAVQKLLDAGFRPTPWSYTTIDPADPRLQNPVTRRAHDGLIPQYLMLDENSVRFQFPEHVKSQSRVVLLRSSYVELRPPRHAEDPDMAKFVKPDPEVELYYPTIPVLLESFIRTLLKEKHYGIWVTTLRAWVLAYLFHLTDVPEDALDECDSDVKEWFHNAIKPYEGTRKIISKRIGRVMPTA